MSRETSIRLPTRLVGVRRDDPNAAPIPSVAAASPPSVDPVEAQRSAAETIPEIDLEAEADRLHAQKVVAELARGTQELKALALRSRTEIKNAAIDLAVALASHFLMQQVEAGAYPFERIAELALERLAPRQPVTVSLHPEDLELLRTRLGDLPALVDIGDLRWTTNAALRRGECRVETPDRSALFDMHDRLAQMRQHLYQIAAEDA